MAASFRCQYTTGHDRFTFADLNLPDVDVAGLLGDLSRGVHTVETGIHLDPDLDRGSDGRLPGWRPALGQTGNSQSHLRNMGIGAEAIDWPFYKAVSAKSAS